MLLEENEIHEKHKEIFHKKEINLVISRIII